VASDTAPFGDTQLCVDARGRLQMEGLDLHDLGDEYGLPLWVISEAAIRSNHQTLRDAFQKVWPNTKIVYASKANPQPSILRVVRDEGCLVDAVTMGHLRLAQAAGFTPGEIVFNGNAKTREELRWALEAGIGYINVDSCEEAEVIAHLQPFDAAPVPICVRLAQLPASFAGDPDMARVAAGSKFGMTREGAIQAASIVAQHPALRLAGVHNHLGFQADGVRYSGALDLERHRTCASAALDLLLELEERFGSLPVVNLGGGYRKTSASGFGPGRITDLPQVDDYAHAVAEEVARRMRGRTEPLLLLLEAGGYLVASAGVLLAKVGLRKLSVHAEEGFEWVFLEGTSAYHFVRRLMYGFFHQVVVVDRPSAEPAFIASVAGPICTGDSVAERVALPSVEPGDVIAVLDQGAYCEAITTDYCAVPIPAVVMVSGTRSQVVRRRQSVDDIVGRYSVPAWLE
jgi:diaminopimelate decarboxylase